MSNNPQKQTYKVDVSWQVEGTVEVKAWNEDDACRKAGEMIDRGMLPKTIRNVPESSDVNDVYVSETQESEAAQPVAERAQKGTDDRAASKSVNDVFELIYPTKTAVKEIVIESKDRANF